jgi:hypothetical protein
LLLIRIFVAHHVERTDLTRPGDLHLASHYGGLVGSADAVST